MAEDVGGSIRVTKAVLEACFEAGKWDLLMEHVQLLSKRRSQLKGAMQEYVRLAISYIDATPDEDTKVKLIETLLAVTMGKIFVEIERARLTKRLAKMKEDAGDLAGATELLQEVAVETFGAMHKQEKIAYILEQVRLCLDRGDNIRAQILAKKISPHAFKRAVADQAFGIEGTRIEPPEEGTPDMTTLKIRYYEMLIRYHAAEDNYLEVCRCYRAIYETDEVQADASRWQAALRLICWFLALAPAGVEHNTLLLTTAADKKLQDLPAYADLLKVFTTMEIAPWNVFSERFEAEMAAETSVSGLCGPEWGAGAEPAAQGRGGGGGGRGDPESRCVPPSLQVFGEEKGAQRREDLKLRVTQHNILVVAKYYSRVTLPRLAELLSLPVEEAETRLCDMAIDKALTVSIDRPKGIVRFGKAENADDILNAWGRNIDRVLDTLTKVTQDISKETMQRAAVAAGGAGTSA